MEKALNAANAFITQHTATSRRMQVAQHNAWFHYQSLKAMRLVSPAMETTHKMDRVEHSKKFLEYIKQGFSLYGFEVNPDDPERLMEMIKSSNIQERMTHDKLSDLSEGIKRQIQLGSLISTLGHYDSDVTEAGYYHDLYTVFHHPYQE